MADKAMKIPGSDHPISIDANSSRVVVTVCGKVVADTRHFVFVHFDYVSYWRCLCFSDVVGPLCAFS